MVLVALAIFVAVVVTMFVPDRMHGMVVVITVMVAIAVVITVIVAARSRVLGRPLLIPFACG
jgi:hypothetical protein